MGKQALVTGGAGFIGSHLVKGLLSDGWNVRVLDNLSSGSLENLRSFEADVDVVVGDVRNPVSCERACVGVDSVFHLAAIVSVVSSVENPMLTHEVTLSGTLNMLLAARKAGTRRFIFSSSSSVYGNAESVPTTEKQGIDPQSPYAVAKAAGEFYCHNFHALYGLETVSLRYFNVFGPRQNATSGYAAVIPCFVQAVMQGETPRIYGDGLQTRDFVYVENIVSANLQATLPQVMAGHVCNVGSGESISLLDLLAMLERLTGRNLKPDFHAARPGEVRHSRADISHARCVLNYEPTISLAAGLKRTLEGAPSLGANLSLQTVHA